MLKIIKAEEMGAGSKAKRTFTPPSVVVTVANIIENVIKRGDEALREYTREFDGIEIDEFELPKIAIDKAIDKVEPEFVKIMENAARNIEDFHRNQIQKGFDLPPNKGVLLGQKVTPIQRVGLYIPGGSASYPSTVLMNCIPAKIAGVSEIIIATPPNVNAHVLAAAKITGVDRIFTIGGAQAIAALAYGTETVPSVDKITGPGNMYVTEAKRQVYGFVGIDMIAGPSDILIIADKAANPEHIAADMLSQCEHGTDSPAILITECTDLAEKVRTEVENQLSTLSRGDIARKAINEHGLIVIVKSIDAAIEISNNLAPEHLELMIEEPFSHLDKVKNAGSIFMGRFTPEAVGDYYAGPNHTLPTSGTARFSGPLSVDDFIKKSSYTYYSEEALKAAGNEIIKFAEEEGLTAHALSVSRRLK
jgi:histidinol dehydrogenase